MPTDLTVIFQHQPGELARLARLLADANVNVDLASTTFGGAKTVIATDDLASARAALPYTHAHAGRQPGRQGLITRPPQPPATVPQPPAFSSHPTRAAPAARRE
jgi:hypothetical protein